jgi:hypothetical protein
MKYDIFIVDPQLMERLQASTKVFILLQMSYRYTAYRIGANDHKLLDTLRTFPVNKKSFERLSCTIQHFRRLGTTEGFTVKVKGRQIIITFEPRSFFEQSRLIINKNIRNKKRFQGNNSQKQISQKKNI